MENKLTKGLAAIVVGGLTFKAIKFIKDYKEKKMLENEIVEEVDEQ